MIERTDPMHCDRSELLPLGEPHANDPVSGFPLVGILQWGSWDVLGGIIAKKPLGRKSLLDTCQKPCKIRGFAPDVAYCLARIWQGLLTPGRFCSPFWQRLGRDFRPRGFFAIIPPRTPIEGYLLEEILTVTDRSGIEVRLRTHQRTVTWHGFDLSCVSATKLLIQFSVPDHNCGRGEVPNRRLVFRPWLQNNVFQSHRAELWRSSRQTHPRSPSPPPPRPRRRRRSFAVRSHPSPYMMNKCEEPNFSAYREDSEDGEASPSA